jgi:hypothetical protein
LAAKELELILVLLEAPFQNMNIGPSTLLLAETMKSLPGALSPFEDVGQTVPHEGVQVPARQVLTGLQLIWVPKADVRVTFSLVRLIPGELFATTVTIC